MSTTEIPGMTSEVYEDTLRCRSTAVKTFSLHCRVALRDDSHSMLSTVTRVTINLSESTSHPAWYLVAV